MPISADYIVAFPVSGGIYGVSALADRLTTLVRHADIAAWHPGNWVGWPHVSINIAFESQADADFARLNCVGGPGEGTRLAANPIVA